MDPAALRYLTLLVSLTQQPTYLVGGSVRDLHRGKRDLRDVDLLIPSGSDAVARAFAGQIGGSFFFLDQERRISRVVKDTDAAHLQFDFTDFMGPDLPADLGRRDFTVNAMALDVRNFLAGGSLENTIDLFGGREDIRRRIIRVVRAEALDEDPLRLLRAVRFAATLGFTIDRTTQNDIQSRAPLATEPSPERIRDEFFRILAERGAGEYIVVMDRLGLLTRLLPEMDALRGFSPGKYHAYDVRGHSLKAAGYVDSVLDDLPGLTPQYAHRVFEHLDRRLEFFVTRKAALRFACLLHDIAKPDTFSRDDAGHVHFYGHDNLGAERAKETCRRFRLSRITEAVVTNIIRQHMRLFSLSVPGGPSKNAMYRYCRDMGDALPESLILAQADARATYEIMPKERFTDTEKPMAAVLDYYYRKFLKAEARPLVTGQDLIDRGLVPGPRFKEILDRVRERQAAGSISNRKEALLLLDSLE